MFTLKKKLSISCAHHLLDSDSLTTKKCLQLHGHEFLIEVLIKTDKILDGMVIDFGKIKEIVNKLDHQNLNDFIEQPTAENISEYLYYEIETELKKRLDLFILEVTIYETPDSSVTYSK